MIQIMNKTLAILWPGIRKLLQVSIFWISISAPIFLTSQISTAQTSELPELGDHATLFLSPVQEAAIGKTFYRSLVADPLYVSDYELRDYMQNLGLDVGQYADLRGVPLTFSLVKDNNLNAFAVPGGYITFNTGLLMATDSESELASVVGHEIAHLTQRHLPRLLAKADEQKIPALAAIIGSILIGGQAGIAGFTATNAALMANQLRYSRAFEQEADAIGIRLLAEAQYDPRAMAEFFGKLERFTRHDNTEIPAFLKTHPLSYTRVAESESRASEYPPQPRADSFEYILARARIRALFVERQDDPLLFFDDQIRSDQELERHAARYGIAAAYLKNRDYENASVALEPLVKSYPEHPWIQTLDARIKQKQGNFDDAIAKFDELSKLHPQKLFISYYRAQAYLANDQPDLAIKTLRYQIRRNSEDYVLYSLLSDAYADNQSYVEAHQAKAEYNALLGNYRRAITVLKLALKLTDEEGYLGQSIKARIPELEEQARFLKASSKI
jgi:predicted Zn-dependent protease